MAGQPTGAGEPLLVVAAAVTDSSGRLLLQQRPPEKHHGGLWEFPGGKVEQGESPEEALVREIAEELGVALELALLRPAATAAEDGHGRQPAIVLNLYTVSAWQGDPAGLDGQVWGWFTAEEAAALPLAPMDRQLLSALCAKAAG